MLIILLLFALIRTLCRVPLSSPLEAPDEVPVLILRNVQGHFGQRAVSDVITSCVATIFACTWSAVHLNIPLPTDCAWTCFKRQFVTMLYALLAPEAITAWALRQHLGAKKIVNEYNQEVATDKGEYKCKPNFILRTIQAFFQDSSLPASLTDGEVPRWTLTHGFFLQMGGFMLSEGGRPIQTLSDIDESYIDSNTVTPNIKKNILNGTIDAPVITKEEIEDRSKGDAISKALIIVQTTWFITQCIARWFSRLPVSELEVVTLGFAVLNGITCWLWWYKPQNVGRPALLEIKRKNLPEDSSMKFRTESRATNYFSSTTTLILHGSEITLEPTEINDSQRSQHSEMRESASVSTSKKTSYPEGKLGQDFNKGRSPEDLHRNRSESGSSSSSTATLVECASRSIPPDPPEKKTSYPRRKLRQDSENRTYGPGALLWQIPLLLVGALLRPIGKLADVEVENHLTRDIVRRGDLRVPMFFAGYREDSKVHKITTLIGILFGSVHLATSWTLTFSSMQEMLLWRVSAIITTIAPIFLIFWDRNNFMDALVVIWLSLYVTCRIMLLVLSLVSLRTLPPAALQAIDWTTFIPHI